MPCFKAGRTGAEVKVSKQLESKAKEMLNEFESYKKPTKLKKGASLADETFIKTVNPQWSNKPKSKFLAVEGNGNRSRGVPTE